MSTEIETQKQAVYSLVLRMGEALVVERDAYLVANTDDLRAVHQKAARAVAELHRELDDYAVRLVSK